VSIITLPRDCIFMFEQAFTGELTTNPDKVIKEAVQ